MNNQERANFYALCAEIAVEERGQQLTHLIIELNQLLARYAQTLEESTSRQYPPIESVLQKK